MQDIIERIGRCGIIPVVKLDDAAQAVPLANALLDGGIPVVEVTFRTQAAEAALRAITAECPGMLVLAGTVINPDLAQKARAAGARLVVSPGYNPETVAWCTRQGLPVVPGVATPGEIESALMHGLSVLKLFPAEVLGGTRLLDALKGPFPGVRFVPTGGITERNLTDYLQRGNVIAAGGTWMVPADALARGDWGTVTGLAQKAVAAAQAARR